MKRKSFVFYASYLDAANILTSDERNDLFRAIVEYGINGQEPTLKGAPLACWFLIKPQLDANNRKYECGKRGGRPPKSFGLGYSNSETTGYCEKETIGYFEMETKPKPNEDDNDNENVQQRPPAPPAAAAPHKGALGGKTVLDSTVTPKERDPATEEARRRFFNSMKRPAWAAADAAPPDADTEDLEDV